MTPGSLAELDIACLRADNPGPYSLSGTNTWVVGRDPAWVVDPGPALDEHLDAVAAEVAARGGAGGIAVTHDHLDHVEGVPGLRARLGGAVPVAAARYRADVRPDDGSALGPFIAYELPGHADDHLVFVAGALRAYLEGLRRLRALDLAVLCPGHGPEVWEPAAKLDGYIAHRLDRERRLLDALAAGVRGEEALLDAAWDDAPAALRPAAAVTLRAHLEKLREEGRLPADLE